MEQMGRTYDDYLDPEVVDAKLTRRAYRSICRDNAADERFEREHEESQ